MRRIINQELPDGSIRQVQPFHISLEGLKTAVLCRDERDYDAMVKILCIAARRKNVIVIIYAVVSNHCHLAVLATSQEDAYACGQEIKKMYGMWFNRRYSEKAIMKGVDVKAILLDRLSCHVPERTTRRARSESFLSHQAGTGADHA